MLQFPFISFCVFVANSAACASTKFIVKTYHVGLRNSTSVSNQKDGHVFTASQTPQHRRLVETLTPVGQSMLGTRESEYGTAVKLSSTDGKVLAVGAPHHDYSTPNADPSKVSIKGGGIFLYSHDGAEWRLSFFFAGVPSEQIGSHLALSSDGCRIAIRRNKALSTTFNQVEVYDVSVKGVATKVGSDLSCGGSGNSVSLSSDGNRIALSCHNIAIGRRLVAIFEWKVATSKWVSIGQVGDVDDTKTGTEFGRSISLNDSGNRLAVSAHTYDFGSVTNRGLVRVYDYSRGITWIPVGGDVLGGEADNKFGFSMALSGDGLSFIASATSSTSFGAVLVYSLVSGGWKQSGDSLFGMESGEIFGRSVAINQDGSRIAASAYLNEGQQGYVKVFNRDDNQWILSGMIRQNDTMDRLDHGLMSVALTSDGNSVAAGSTGWRNLDGLITGGVSVHTIPRMISSLAPSGRPTAVLTAATQSPTMMLSESAWDLKRVGNVTVFFNNRTDNEELLLTYNISNRKAEITVFEGNCVTVISNEIVGMSTKTTINTSTHSDLKIALALNADNLIQLQNGVLGQSPWIGTISVCVRVDLTRDDVNNTSVHFHEQKLFVFFELGEGLAIKNVTEAVGPASEELSAVIDYEIIACQCNETLMCSSENLVQGDDLLVCVFSNHVNTSVIGIDTFSLVQSNRSIIADAIVNFEADNLTLVTLLRNVAVIRSQMLPEFFAVDGPKDVRAIGVVILSLMASTSTSMPWHRVLIDNSHFRALGHVKTGFEVRISLSNSTTIVSKEREQKYDAFRYFLLVVVIIV